MLDVGANVGQSARRFLHAFQDAHVHCFEPVQATFDVLRGGVDARRATCHRLALSSECGTSRMRVRERSTTSSLADSGDDGPSEEVEVTTIDAFAAAKGIDGIDLLKVDAEGHDMAVLEGARDTLAERRITFVLVEVGFRRASTKFTLFDDVRDLLAGHGFDVLGLYDQTPAWSGKPRLHYANALFALQDA